MNTEESEEESGDICYVCNGHGKARLGNRYSGPCSHCGGTGEVMAKPSEEGPTDAQQELSQAGHEAADTRYRQQMTDAGRGHLLP